MVSPHLAALVALSTQLVAAVNMSTNQDHFASSNPRSAASSVHGTTATNDLSIADEIMRNLDLAIAGIDPNDHDSYAQRETLQISTVRQVDDLFGQRQRFVFLVRCPTIPII